MQAFNGVASFDDFLNFSRDGPRLEGEEGNEAKNFASKMVSPLEIALVTKTDLATVQEIYEGNPKALTEDLLCKVCRHGCQEGVVGFLAAKLPKGVSHVDRNGQLPIHYLMTQGPRAGMSFETDLWKLVEIFPEAALLEDSDEWAPWEMALHYRIYSSNFIKLLFHKLSQKRRGGRLKLSGGVIWNGAHERETTHRHALDMDCVAGMIPVFSSIQIFCCRDNPWKIDAFLRCLQMVFQNANISTLQLKLPILFKITASGNALMDSGDNTLQDEMTAAITTLVKLAPECGVECLEWNFGDGHIVPSLRDLMLDLTLRMPRLKDLTLVIGLQPETVAALTQILRTSLTLEALVIQIRVNHDEGDLSPVWDALAGSSVLKTFRFVGDLPERRLEEYRDHLVTLLHVKNTALKNAEVKVGQDKATDPRPPSELQAKINYYTQLNRYGRATARNPKIMVPVFVQLLLCLQEETKTDNLGALECSNIRYGILREVPGLWGAGAQETVEPLNRKRKANSLSLGCHWGRDSRKQDGFCLGKPGSMATK